MTSVHAAAEHALAHALAALGLQAVPARLMPCPRRAHGDAAVGAALQAAPVLKRSPMAIAEELAAALSSVPEIASLAIAPPGYINISFSDTSLAAALEVQLAHPEHGIRRVKTPETVVIDFGGPNIKPMHVGHLRSLVIGEALRRMLSAVGHHVISDIHLGDWGLPSGMILAELRHRMPDAAWFAADTAHPPTGRLPVSAADLATLYPAAAAACRADEARMREAREVTAALQAGDPGLSSLWRSIVAEAKTAILATCDRLGAQFDLTLGESDAQPEIPELLAHMEATGKARREDGALMVDVACPADAHPVPPLVLEKADGSALYATTDLATLLMRRRDLEAERILYVVDGRQHLHFLQLFRAAEIAGIATADKLEHIAFGTVNGADGKPFKTRAGDVMSLVELLDLAKAKAKERLQAGGRLQDAAPETVEDAADAVGMAALRVADLLANRSTGYRLDLDRAIAFEGKTGPYLLYALVRLRALLTKAGDDRGPIRLGCPAERRLALACLGLDGALQRAVATRSPHELTSWAFDLAAEVSRFYGDCPVIGEADPTRRHSRIALCMAAERALSYALHLLGCRVPVAM